jgi:hypothetical protein
LDFRASCYSGLDDSGPGNNHAEVPTITFAIVFNATDTIEYASLFGMHRPGKPCQRYMLIGPLSSWLDALDRHIQVDNVSTDNCRDEWMSIFC